MDVEELVVRAIDSGFKDLDRVREWAREAVLMRPDPTLGVGARGSRLGGMPTLLPTTPWPKCGDTHLGFVAQIDLSTLPATAARQGLPTTGLLSFFYDPEQRAWGFDPNDAGHFAVVYVEDPARAVTVTRTPDDVPEEARYTACGLTPDVTLTLPSWESLIYEESRQPPEQREAYWLLLDALFNPEESSLRCLIGGHPDQVQGDMLLECALATTGINCGGPEGYRDPRVPALRETAREWRLLLQVPSEDLANMMWGDCGCLYFWIRESDLRARRFERAWMILQCS